jgi:3-phosphoshikimate 1-carboxyvinyltransferase
LNLITSPGNSLHGSVSLPGDKSISHRAALFPVLAEGESRIENFPNSGVSQVMLSALSALGVERELNGSSLRVDGCGLTGLVPAKEVIDCGNSATTLRLLAGVLAAAGIPAVLDGSRSLQRRPMGRIVKPLKAMGVQVEANQRWVDQEQITAPLRFTRRDPWTKLKAINTCLHVASAQVKSCLLLAALAADAPTVIHEPAVSRDHTERMLRCMGIDVQCVFLESEGLHTVTLVPLSSLSLKPLSFKIPGDISSAAFLIVAALITPGSEITMKGVLLNPTRTGLIDALISMGADINIVPGGEIIGEPFGDVTIRHSPLEGAQICGNQVVSMIDEFPAFSIAAAFAEGDSIVKDSEELRHKESDRISGLCIQLRALGVAVDETHDGFIIHGGKGVQGGVVDPQGDHRLAMAFSIAGLAATEPVIVRNAEIISESYPGFVSALQSLGGELTVKGWGDEG